jgi:hypothetical protein
MKKELKDFVEMIKNGELLNVKELEFDKELELEFINDINEFWNDNTFENRDIVLEDLKADEGILYLKMIEWSNILIKYDLNFDCFEYSIEDFFRDTFNNSRDDSDFKLFSIDDINKMMYGR